MFRACGLAYAATMIVLAPCCGVPCGAVLRCACGLAYKETMIALVPVLCKCLYFVRGCAYC
eukprot:11037332-Lingulodinium_polyedra.AAC.1